MLSFKKHPPEGPGDVELGGAGTRYDIKLIGDGDHALFNADPVDGFRLLGMVASHGISEPRIASSTIDAKPEDTLEIARPVVRQIADLSDRDKAIWFARGVFHGLKIDFPDFRKRDDWEQHELFQTLISDVSEEAAEAIRRREDSNASTPVIS